MVRVWRGGKGDGKRGRGAGSENKRTRQERRERRGLEEMKKGEGVGGTCVEGRDGKRMVGRLDGFEETDRTNV
jgi:hypothetical protein